MIKREKGITLIALVVTIVVLLILAGVSISMLGGENGIITQAQEAKKKTEIAKEKEIIGLSSTVAKGENGWGEITEEKLQVELNKNTGEGKTEATDVGDEIEVVFKDSNRYYSVDKNGNVGDAQEIIKDKNPGDITTGKDGEQLDGSEKNPYEIWCIEDLVDWSQKYETYINSHIKLCRSLNFYSKLSYSNGKILECNSIEELIDLLTNIEGNGFTPIKQFSGTLDGQEFEIRNIYINKIGRAGLFETLRDSNIYNLGISGNINGTEEVGGISGLCSGEVVINNCYNEANIFSANGISWMSSGGICGALGIGKISITNSYNSEKVKIEGKRAGGILGSTGVADSTPIIYNCYNLGQINGEIVGGIVGYIYDHVECANVYSTGKITGTRVGGIIGSALWDNREQNKFKNCYFLKSENVQQGGGVQITVDATILENLTSETINELNTYITSNTPLTSNWKKWKLKTNEYPIFE